MKKILALVLALMMALTAFAAIAEDVASPVEESLVGTDNEAVAVTEEVPAFAEAVVAEMAAAVANGESELSVLDEDTQAAVAAIVGEDAEVSEIVTMTVTGEAADQEVTFSFATAYEAGAKVALLVGVPAGEEIEWTAVEGVANEDGTVTATLPAALVAKLADTEAVVMVVNAK